MARKANQPKNGMDRHTSSHRKKGSDSGSAVPDMTRRGQDSKVKVFPGEELPNGNHPGSPIMESVNKAYHAGDESTKKQPSSQRQDMEQPVSSESNSGDHIENISLKETCGVKEENAGHSKKHGKSGLGCLLNGLHVQSEKLSDSVLVRSLKAHLEYILKGATEFLEKQRPLFVTLRTNIYSARDYGRMKIEQVYPVVLNCLRNFVNILLLLSMVWLDCALRGIDSFLRMGTTSFFSAIWCSIFSIIAMVGMFKFLMVLVIGALMAVFIGFTLVIIVLAISGIVFLWFYGSFWTTMLVVFLGGLAFKFSHERLALFIITVYSTYCAWIYVGWLGFLLALNLSFVSSDILLYFLKNNINQQRRPPEQTAGMQGGAGFFNGEPHASSSDNIPGFSTDRSPGVPSTSGADSEITSEDEVVRLLNCTDHYSALGLSLYENVDVSVLKREYRKKAMLVHPDKNMGNEKAAEAFKKLQNAYEVLLDSLKRKSYDDELRREELLNCFRRFQSASQKNGGHGFFGSGFPHSEADNADPLGDSRRIACKKCGNFHVWIQTKKSKSQARWCQECKDYHQAKDGDGWVEQSSQHFLFGLLQKVDVPCAYVCADSKIYNATEWYICQGMRCPANTHKPSFHVNTSLTSKHSSGKGTNPGQRGNRIPTPPNLDESMTEEEFMEWLQNAVQAGMFDNFAGGSTSSTTTEAPSPKAGTGSKGSGTSNSGSSNNKRKKKGKKQW
ncbi:hypothetical protein LWI29_014346 [Acer saccharum]|uniref:J domain-containing protein n=1 Tax=Acer saccharum TaxID=4024 RepID=A0AA39TFP3_ACESA|nr:hypothetical protein LWI29_014346 [Acer saccharum]